jgi:ribosomal 30S subunit maturation factor RimM
MKNEQKEEFKVTNEELEGKIREIIKSGEAQRIIIKNENNERIIEIPLTVGTVEAVFVPVLAAVKAIAEIPFKYIIIEIKK